MEERAAETDFAELEQRVATMTPEEKIKFCEDLTALIEKVNHNLELTAQILDEAELETSTETESSEKEA